MQAPRGGRAEQPDRHAARRDVPGRPGRHRRACWSRWASPPARSCRRANGASCTRALDCAAVAAIHPFYTASDPRVRGRRPADRRLRAGRRTTAPPPGCEAIGAACGVAAGAASTPPRTASCPRSAARSPKTPIKGRITLSGYEGSELLVARLLIESGADVPYVGTACPRTPWSRRRPRLARGARACTSSSAPRSSRTSPRCASSTPDLAIGTTPVVQARQGAGDPGALLHQPDLGAAADGRRPAPARSRRSSTRRIGNQARFDAMKEFFDGVGAGHAAGVWETTCRRTAPSSRPTRAPARQGGAAAQGRGDDREGTDARPRSRPRRRLLGRRLRLHRDQGPAGHHRRPGRLREPAGHLGAALHRRAAAARTADRRHRASARKSSAATAPKAR